MKALPPAVALVGEIEVIDGTGLFWGGGEVELPPTQLTQKRSANADAPKNISFGLLVGRFGCSSVRNICAWVERIPFRP